MSMAAAQTLRERAGGKWQIPAVLVSLVLLGAAIARLRSVQVHYPVEAYLAQLEARVADGYYTAAIDYGTRLLARDDFSPADRAVVHTQLARAHFHRAERERRTTPESADRVRQAFEAAYAAGAPKTADDLVRLAEAHVWRNEFAAAVGRLEEARSLAVPPALAVRRRMIELMQTRLKNPADEVLAALDGFIVDAADDTGALHWAVAAKIDLLSAEGRTDEAIALLDALRDRFEHSAHRAAYGYLESLVDYRLGRCDEAEARLRALRNALRTGDELYAMSGWLLGRTVLSDGRLQRPQEAASFFQEVIDVAPRDVYAAASRIGLGEAFAALGRYAESLAEFRRVTDAVRENASFAESTLLESRVIQATAATIAERLRREGELEASLQFYEFASSLLDPADEPERARHLEVLGELRAGLAARLLERARDRSDTEEADEAQRGRWESDARYLFVEAAEGFLELARLKTLNESRAADSVWRAVDLFDAAGATRRTVATLERFLVERPANERIPQALLRLGQARQALGLYAEAIEAYQENLRRFPRTPDAGSGLIPLARCYMARGPAHVAQAVETLDVILRDSAVFTPEAPEFRDALFLLGDIHHSEGEYERGIAVLEEALERYPDDSRSARARFLLADAYRQSGLALERESAAPEAAYDRPGMREASNARFRRAAKLFAELVETLAGEDSARSLDPGLRGLLAKHARLYQADCLFELGSMSEAVALYETAAFIYRDEPSALSAYVQIVNCRLSLGQPAEARTALRRAKYLLQVIPDAAFEGAYAGQSRREWERYMDWLERSDLF